MFKKIFLFLTAVMFIFGMSKISLAMMCGSGSGHSEHTQVAKAENVGNKICPVSGEKIDEKTKATYEYEGKIYNFCCPMCVDEFKKDPKKYIKRVEEELQAGSKKEEGQESTMDSDMGMPADTHGGHHH